MMKLLYSPHHRTTHTTPYTTLHLTMEEFFNQRKENGRTARLRLEEEKVRVFGERLYRQNDEILQQDGNNFRVCGCSQAGKGLTEVTRYIRMTGRLGGLPATSFSATEGDITVAQDPLPKTTGGPAAIVGDLISKRKGRLLQKGKRRSCHSRTESPPPRKHRRNQGLNKGKITSRCPFCCPGVFITRVKNTNFTRDEISSYKKGDPLV